MAYKSGTGVTGVSCITNCGLCHVNDPRTIDTFDVAVGVSEETPSCSRVWP